LKLAEIEWVEPVSVKIPDELLQAAGNDHTLAEALARRGILTLEKAAAFLDPRKYRPSSPIEIPGVETAVERIARAISSAELIGVWGDFDADGQTSTAILYSSLQILGARVTYYIPVRARESHGVSIPALDTFLKRGVNLVLTCDSGVTAHDAVDFAKTRGVDFVITDHHTLPPELPSAIAVVNPQRLPGDHPLRPLCGAGTAYKLAEALFDHYGRLAEAAQFLDLAAIGTIADLVALTGDNRYLVQTGLEQIRRSPRPALKALLNQAEINYTQITEEHISFIVAPRLNAIGRLSDANPAVPFLLATEASQVTALASEIETLNTQRKLLCDQVFQGALAQLQSEPDLLDGPALILSHPNWPAGVIGIAASRLVEFYQKPVVLIACPPGEAGRASARSIEGINITAALAANQQMLLTFGGHPMAAGFAIDPEKIPQFRAAFNHTVEVMAGAAQVTHTLSIDLILPLERLTLDLVETLDRLSPYGPGNPPFKLAARNLEVKGFSPIGKAREHMQITVEGPSGATRKIIWWQGAGLPLPEERFDLAFTVRASNYRGERSIQIEWIHARPIDEEVAVSARRPSIQALDYRKDPDPATALKNLLASGAWLVFREGEKALPINGVDRYHLSPVASLALWTIPPGLNELRTVLDAVQPSQVAIFGISSFADQLTPFLQRLAGLIRFALTRRDGQVSLQDLAAATCQREMTIRKGIIWWIAHGELSQVDIHDTVYFLRQGGLPDQVKLTKVEQELNTLLQETAAFRSYYLRVAPQQLLD
jgi:single-stranded-DNA-specific exonuclease